ncbi:hypothetical protein MMC27_005900 [Xylographa pallens]|nr:hypothetical protein [Xylographa pallens]
MSDNSETPGFLSLMERFSSQVEISGIQTAKYQYDLLSFLATAQKLGVDFLPITWQSGRQSIGSGGTSRIEEAYQNKLTRFAFKRIRNSEKREKSESDIFQMLTTEITVLSHPFIREHQNIAQLQGICWDISSDNRVWPVLVFERAQFGDLYNFASGSEWKKLNIRQRAKLCFDVGDALADMHSSNIIHGDIKPENVLIFSFLSKTYTAKVTDFGYSSRYGDEKHLIRMPISQPWGAPEHAHTDQQWTPAEAKTMDIFSFGMLSLWTLFKERLSQMTLLEETEQIEEYPGFSSERKLMVTLLKLKDKGKLSSLARQLVRTDKSLNSIEKANLEDFFGSVLINDQSKRDKSLSTNIPGDKLEKLELTASAADFKIEASVVEFYGCDYRVRSYIAKYLETLFHKESDSCIEAFSAKIAFQLALCYQLGFGIKRDEIKSKEVLRRSEPKEIDLRLFFGLHPRYPRARTALILFHDGHLPITDDYTYYLEQQILGEAKLRLSQEADDLSLTLGPDNFVTLCAQNRLSNLLWSQGLRKEAEEINLRIIETSLNASSNEDSAITLVSMNNLALIYLEDGRWEEAEKLLVQLVKKISVLGREHAHTITSMKNLALTFLNNGRWKKAEELGEQVVKTSTHVLGDEHPSTLSTLMVLATIYSYQGRWDETEKLCEQAMKSSLGVLDAEDPLMLKIKANLAYTYSTQGRKKADQRRQEEGEILEIQVIEARKRVLGSAHPCTLESIECLASTYGHQKRWREAEKLLLEVIEIRRIILDAEHPLILSDMKNLSAFYQRQGRTREAKNLSLQVMEARKKVLGVEHPDTLESIADLARDCMEERRWKEAKDLNVQVVENRKKVLGAEHPDTLVSMINLALTNIRLGERIQDRWREVEALSLKIIELSSRTQSAEHPDPLSGMWNLAMAYRNLNRRGEALSLMESVEELYSKALGALHSDSLRARDTLRAWKET